MDLPNNKIVSEKDYMDFVEKFVTLLNMQLEIFEQKTIDKDDLINLVQSMPALISLVNTVGYLRGQGGMFLEIRSVTASQKQLYSHEDMFEARLNKLIDVVLNSEVEDIYKERLDTYFLKARTQGNTAH